jgi:hypothetical protein
LKTATCNAGRWSITMSAARFFVVVVSFVHLAQVQLLNECCYSVPSTEKLNTKRIATNETHMCSRWSVILGAITRKLAKSRGLRGYARLIFGILRGSQFPIRPVKYDVNYQSSGRRQYSNLRNVGYL